MRIYTRVIFGLNTLYQLLVGAVFLFAPVAAIGLYGFGPAEALSVAAHVSCRALGAYILLGAGISALIARNPDRHPILLALMGVLSLLTFLCWGLALAAAEVTLGQVALDLVIQALLLIAVVGYYKTAGQKA